MALILAGKETPLASATRKPVLCAALLAVLACLVAACAPATPALPPTNLPPTASPAPLARTYALFTPRCTRFATDLL